MKMGPYLSAAEPFELRMVDGTQDWLEEQGRKHDETNDGVVVDPADI